MSNYITVGGGWTGQSATGESFIRIKFKNDVPSGLSFNMWKNKDRKTDKHPDYLIKARVEDAENKSKQDKKEPDTIF